VLEALVALAEAEVAEVLPISLEVAEVAFT
jgi:hypothetical protein